MFTFLSVTWNPTGWRWDIILIQMTSMCLQLSCLTIDNNVVIVVKGTKWVWKKHNIHNHVRIRRNCLQDSDSAYMKLLMSTYRY